MPDYITTSLLAMAVIFIGSFIQSTIGFGMAIVSAPLLFHISSDYVPAPIVMVAMFLSLIMSIKNRANIQIGQLKVAVIGRIPGSLVGGFVLAYISAATLSLWLGIAVLISLIISLLPFRIEPTKSRMAIAGCCAGFMGTTSSIGGPPMAILLQHQDAHQFRGNLSAFFFVSSIMSLTVLLFFGFLTLHHIYISLPLFPAAWLGFQTAQLIIHKLSKQWVRRAALLLCLISGLGAIMQGLSM